MKVLDCKHCKKGPSLFKDYYEGYYLTCGDCGRSTLTYENLTRCKDAWNKMHEGLRDERNPK